jgi:hypothetical protein
MMLSAQLDEYSVNKVVNIISVSMQNGMDHIPYYSSSTYHRTVPKVYLTAK